MVQQLLAVDTASGALKGLSASDAQALVGVTGMATRTGVFPWEPCNTFGTVGANAQLSIFRLAQIAVNATRFRLHIRQYDQLNDTSSTTADLTGVTAFIGDAATDVNGEYTGAFTSAPTQIITSSSIATGTELVSGWITPSTFNLTAGRKVAVSVGFTVGSAGKLSAGGGLQWYTFASADAASANPSRTRADNQGFLAMYLEFEFADAHAPVIMVVSNSSSGGGNTASLANRGELDSWHQQWALARKGIAANIAVGGSWAAMYGSSSPKWNYYSGLATPLTVDAVYLFNLVNSDITAGTALATAKASLVAATLKARALYPSAKIIHTTLSPRIENTAGTIESNRLAMNQWLATCPGGADQCIDINAVLCAPVSIVDNGNGTTSIALPNASQPGRLNTPFNSGDGIHFAPLGHTAIQPLITARRV